MDDLLKVTEELGLDIPTNRKVAELKNAIESSDIFIKVSAFV